MKRNLIHWSSKPTMTNPDTNKYSRYFVQVFSDNSWVVMDSLSNDIVEGTEKHSWKLAKDVADVLNERYEAAMERNRKQVFNDTYFVKS